MTCFYVNSYLRYTRWGNDGELSITPYCHYYCMKQPHKYVKKRRSRFGDIFKGQTPNLEDMIFYQKLMKKNKNKKRRPAKSREKGGNGPDGQSGKPGTGGEGDNADVDGTKGKGSGKKHGGNIKEEGEGKGNEEGVRGGGAESTGNTKGNKERGADNAQSGNAGDKGNNINYTNEGINTDLDGGMGDGKVVGGGGVKDQYGTTGTTGGWGEGAQGFISGKDPAASGMVGGAPWNPSNGAVGAGGNGNWAGGGTSGGIGLGYGTSGGFGGGVGGGAGGWPTGVSANWPGAAPAGWPGGVTGGSPGGGWPGGVTGGWPAGATGGWPAGATGGWSGGIPGGGVSGGLPGNWSGGAPGTWPGGVQGGWSGGVSGGWPGGVPGGVGGGAPGMPFGGMSGYTGIGYGGAMGPTGPAGEGGIMYGIGGRNVCTPNQTRPCPQVCTPRSVCGKQNDFSVHQGIYPSGMQNSPRQNINNSQNFGGIRQPQTYVSANCLQNRMGLSSPQMGQQNYSQYYNPQPNCYMELPQSYAPMQQLPSFSQQYNPQIYGGIQGAPITQPCNRQYYDTYQTNQQIPQYSSAQMRNSYAQQYNQYLRNLQGMYGQFGRTPASGGMMCTPNTNFTGVSAPPAVFAHYMQDIGDVQCNRCATSFSTNHLIKCKTCGQVII